MKLKTVFLFILSISIFSCAGNTGKSDKQAAEQKVDRKITQTDTTLSPAMKMLLKKKAEFLDKDNNKKPLFVINKKIATQEEVEKLNPDDVLYVSMLSGKSAIAAYGEKAEYGVVIVEI